MGKIKMALGSGWFNGYRRLSKDYDKSIFIGFNDNLVSYSYIIIALVKTVSKTRIFVEDNQKSV